LTAFVEPIFARRAGAASIKIKVSLPPRFP